MPNWCNNLITLRHEDKTLIDKIEGCKDSEVGILQTLVPCPEDLMNPETTTWGHGEEEAAREALREELTKKYGFKSWYDWCIANWGTKWDLCEPHITRVDDNTVQISCDTAWSPPVGAFEKLMDMGFEVHAYYYEGGMVFAGIWDNGDDQCYQDWGDSNGARATLPQELDDTFAISESMAEWEEEERREEELYTFVKDGAEERSKVSKGIVDEEV
jgi:hypothetical protein